MEAQQNTHAKLLAIDFLSLTPTPHSSSFSLYPTTSLYTRAETLGVITSLDLKPSKFLRFTIDDSTGSVPCVLWLNHLSSPYFSRRQRDVHLIAHVASRFASRIRLGAVVRARGRIGVFRGRVQITVSDLVLERDPNAETLHWLECIRLRMPRQQRMSKAQGERGEDKYILLPSQ